jgi:hypothetical protein
MKDGMHEPIHGHTDAPMILTCIHVDHPLLRVSLQAVPEMEIEWEREDRNDGSEMLFWAHGGDFGAFDTALEDDPTVTLSRSFAVGDRRLYQVHLTDEGVETDLYPVVVETASLVRQANATHDGWRFELCFADRAALDRFVETCRGHEIGFEIVRLHEWRDDDRSPFGLTGAQCEALRTALEVGYFEIPRESDLGDLGDRLGVSDTAASQRLRRGLSTLLERTVSGDAVPST